MNNGSHETETETETELIHARAAMLGLTLNMHRYVGNGESWRL